MIKFNVLVVSLVLSRLYLDYGNATLAGQPGNQLDRPQSVMNTAARLVCSARKYEHITPLLRDLHWLRVPERIKFKLSVLVFRCLHGDRAFFVAAPRAWNTLPSSVTASETLGTFKRRLKTHLFATSFP